MNNQLTKIEVQLKNFHNRKTDLRRAMKNKEQQKVESRSQSIKMKIME